MSCDFIALANIGIQELSPYQAGKPIEELERELGIKNVVKLASNENPLGTAQSVLDAVIAEAMDICRYPDSNGFELKAALSNKLSVKPAQITLGNGSNDILDLLAQVFLNPNASAIYSQHGFVVYSLAVKATGAEAIVTPAKNWGHDLPAMAAAVKDNTRLVFIANPNNPTGTWVDEATVKAFLDAVPDDVIVVLDEAYCEYVADSTYPNSIALLDSYPNLVVSRTFSKAYGLAGLRVGYSISNPQIADLLNRARGPFNVNSMALAAAQAVLADADYLAKAIEVNNSGLIQLADAFVRLGVDFIPSVGNFISFDAGIYAADIYQSLLEAGVIVRPVGVYEMPSYLRVSVGLVDENEKFIAALEQIIA
ncbi:MAG: histidinol-phosphate aminotransferase [Pseudomonadales bacterium]|jgi:histidinol-phosphate aminotransferase